MFEKLNDHSNMTDLEKSIAIYFLNVGYEIKNKSSRLIASELFVSPSTISRFCQQVGYSGFNQFRESYLSELNYLNSNFQKIDPNNPFTYKDKNMVLVNKLSSLYQETISDTVGLMHHDSLQKTSQMLIDCQKVVIGSAGDAMDIAETFKNRMIKIGKFVHVERRMDNLFYQASISNQDTCFILISYSGEVETIIRTAYILKKRHIPFFVLTSYGNNKLTEISALTLFLSTREKLVDNLGNFSSLLSISFILDTLYANVFTNNYDENYVKKVSMTRDYERKRRSDNPLINDFK
ncbi:MurR/RpiR family transcriptional regulator [Streptococcus parauberis]|uniref:MurR/RpiR family transcriptional regulator n=1 Tax=Streptococcus parauberis TaxID=1348 RepID=UPI0028971B33|nr:MurR/RpiR family transcriptional regulator [Streptococcus parauberis]